MEKVFLLPELLEVVLTHLPQRDLLILQRVNQTWNSLITNNRTIQEKLFFKPTQPHAQSNKHFPITFNPLLQELFPSFYPDEGTLNFEDSCIGTSCEYLKNADTVLMEQAWYEDESRRAAVLRPEASWRRMYASNPAPELNRIGMWLGGCCCGGECVDATLAPAYEEESRVSGIKMGLFWDATFFVVDDNPAGFLSVTWWREAEDETQTRSQTQTQTEGEGSKAPQTNEKYVIALWVEIETSWDCYKCDEAYRPTELKIVDDEALIVYSMDDADLMDLEATPLSLRKRNPGVKRPHDR
ncbi:hypothetical protein BDW74DRAFT_183876 [Aspergillus multicolor]|uniref:uncharacterized protein n=1 Tax=Aspergillus multicolor TaxID=41759 RepID=UPI003CCDB229